MKMTKHLLSLMGVTALAGAAGAATVTLDKVQQRYPWNGLVDIDYTLDGAVSVDTKFQLTVSANGTTYTPTTFQQEFGRTRGTHRVTWDTAKDGAKFFAKNATVTMSLVDNTGDFYIFDLVNGGDPVITNCTAEAFNAPVYKTDKLVMRKIPATTYEFKTYELASATRAGGKRNGTVSVSTFLMGVFELTHGQFQNIMGSAVSSAYTSRYAGYANVLGDKALQLPMNQVSYNDMRGSSSSRAASDVNGIAATVDVNWPDTASTVDPASFIYKLREKINGGQTGYVFDLPTDRQWQCAYRAGTTTAYYDGNDSITDLDGCGKTLNVIGRHGGNSSEGAGDWSINGSVAIVGSYAANAYGLYDMAGNLWEGVLDWSGDVDADADLSAPAAASNAGGTTTAAQDTRIFMGGAYDVNVSNNTNHRGQLHCCGFRHGGWSPAGRDVGYPMIGFRLASSIK